MQYTIGDIITTILEIVDYQGNKARFADEFVGLCYQQGIYDYLSSLPEDTRKQLTEQMNKKAQDDLDKMIEILSVGEHKKPYFEAVALASRKTLEEYLEKIKSHLSEMQKNTLFVFLEGLKEEGKNYLFSI